MSSLGATNAADIESGRRRWGRWRPCSSGTTTDESLCFSLSESDSDKDHRSWHSPLDSTAGGSYDDCRFSEMEGISVISRHVGESSSSASEECLSNEVALESGDLEVKVHCGKAERECRICHLSLVVVVGGGGAGGGDQESGGGVRIELGCSCKGDLGAAHKQCAETWFKIRGNTTCEICGATARNVAGEQTNDPSTAAEAASAAPSVFSEPRRIWHGRRVMNFLLACMVFAFIISWLFHFNVLP